MKAALINALWHAASLPEAWRFHQATARVVETQTRLLNAYLIANQNTAYGRRYQFESIRSVNNYQRHVPLTTYDDYSDLIDCIARGQPNILTAQPVQMFEPSSGSTAASKLIPYPATLKAEFQRGLAPWIADLYSHYPQLRGGPAYWSVTPLAEGRRTTSSGLPIGFEEDSAYLGPLGALIESALAVPNAVKHIGVINAFRYTTLLFLLRQSNLRLISIWNPTYLTLLIKFLPEWWNDLLTDIAAGTLSPPQPLDPVVRRRLQPALTPDPTRARILAALSPDDYSAIWPHLSLISCWADGPAAGYARTLQQSFPNITLQPKGLLATEAFVSFPLVGQEGSMLAITSHFFEFLPTETFQRNISTNALLAHQLEKGQTYAVVVTTGGGFCRYQLQDIIEVVEFVGQAPCIRFVGKQDHVSDWFGEKLSEPFVAGALAKLFSRHQLSPTFAMLAPDDERDFCYTLYLELPPDQHHNNLHCDLDAALSANFHYAYCRQLGQLVEPRLVLVVNGAEAYLQGCQSRGQKLGNIKPAALQKTTGWSQWFQPLQESNG